MRDLKLGYKSLVLLANAFIWYFLAFNILRELISTLSLSDSEIISVLGANFIGIAVSGIIGSFAIDKLKKRVPFIYGWIVTGIFISILPIVFRITNSFELFAISAIFGVYFGSGMPITMGYFATSTKFENRSRLSGITFLIVGLAFALLGNIGTGNVLVSSIILAGVRLIGLLLFCWPVLKECPTQEKGKITYRSIVSNRSVILYFLPWCMFNLVNYLTIPFMTQLFTAGDFLQFATIFENIIIAIFALFSGFLSDIFGRKRLTIIGFAMLGIGYAILGVAHNNIVGWYFYTIVDGIAWGIFYTILLFTIWGDLAQGRPSDKLYVMGALPYLFSNFMRFLVGPYVSSIPETAIFSFASFFLFLAVLPLVYAPETLPEKTLKDRDLKSYTEKALKQAQKTAEKNQQKDGSKKEPAESEGEAEEKTDQYEEARKLAEKYY